MINRALHQLRAHRPACTCGLCGETVAKVKADRVYTIAWRGSGPRRGHEPGWRAELPVVLLEVNRVRFFQQPRLTRAARALKTLLSVAHGPVKHVGLKRQARQ